ncbi:MAG: endonuclease MutS2 [Campylobacteraceae bacterium]|nr:endonuclease MutS2 [Campylobacteraceae bacterium]
MQKLISKLDLDGYITNYKNFLAREKPIFMEGDTSLHFRFIKELQNYDLNPPLNVDDINQELTHLSKHGVLHIKQIWEFVKIIRYFLYLKQKKLEGVIDNWLQNITVPPLILEMENWFDKNGELKEEIDVRFSEINTALKIVKEKINSHLKTLLSSSKLQEFLVDTQIHFLNGQEAFLLRGGFNSVIKGSIAGRSSGGYFYVSPHSLESYKKQESDLADKKENLIYEYAKKISVEFQKQLSFLKFINKEFDRFDHYMARVLFAKRFDMEFILPAKESGNIILKDFSHPALHEPKPINVNFKKSILLVTGVNAGGKTMLLKSLLAAAFLAKYLLPMKINAANSQIGNFKDIKAIIEDPQNVKNDISTFAGRMIEFSKLFTIKNALVGVDEIELGTDADEAANLFCAILESLVKKGIKIIITTHHKRLASMLASNEHVELLAALYDEKAQKPLYGFLEGTIGKSYAFETALRYGIAQNIVEKARALYGEDKEKLNELIQKNIDLELQNRTKLKEFEQKEQIFLKLTDSLKEQKEEQKEEFEKIKREFEGKYAEAISLAKEAAREKSSENIHRVLNKANKIKAAIITPKIEDTKEDIKAGDRVKYGELKGVVISVKKESASIESEGITMHIPKSALKKISSPQLKPSAKKGNIFLQRPSNAGMILDLHGLRSDEAVEKTDKFLSDALLTGFDEVQIYHGVGTGKLAFAIKNFLKTHPSVKEFFDAPANNGGAGATIVRL